MLLVGIGKLARAALEAAESLARPADGIDATVVDPRVVRPADASLVERMAGARLVVTVEDGLAHGGAGAFLLEQAEALALERGLPGPHGLVLGVPTRYIPQGKPDDILAGLGLDAAGIAASVRRAAERHGLVESPAGSG